MAFVVDASQWCFDGWRGEDIVATLDAFFVRIYAANDRNEQVWAGDDLQSKPVLGENDLWSLFSPDAPVSLPQELRQELSAVMGRIAYYTDEEDWPDGFTEADTLSIGGEPAVENLDVSWAHHNLRRRVPVACLSLVGCRAGAYDTVSECGSVTVFWVTVEREHRAFHREAIDVVGDGEAVIERMAPHAWPDLHFHDGIWHGLNDFQGGYHAVRVALRKCLSVLDDWGAWAFTCPPPALRPADPVDRAAGAMPSNQLIEKRLAGLGLTASPEKPNVYQDKKCREAREINLGDAVFYCEWHIKLAPDRNRVHIHAPHPNSNRLLIVAIFHEHLKLPT